MRYSCLQLLYELLFDVMNIPVKIIMAVHYRTFSAISFVTIVSSGSVVDLQPREITCAKLEITNFIKCV